MLWFFICLVFPYYYKGGEGVLYSSTSYLEVEDSPASKYFKSILSFSADITRDRDIERDRDRYTIDLKKCFSLINVLCSMNARKLFIYILYG